MAEEFSSNADTPDRGSSNIVSIQSTADGDIQIEEKIIEEKIASSPNNNTDDSVKAFTHHLKDSWDEVPDGVYDAGDNEKPHTMHKQNLSVQFLDFNISGDGVDAAVSGVDGGKPSPNDNEEGKTHKETVENKKGEYSSSILKQDDDKTSFANNIRKSWEEPDEDNDTTAHNSPSWGHRPTQSVQFLDSTMLEYAADLPVNKQNDDHQTEEVIVATKSVATAEAFEPPASSPSSREHTLSQLSPREIEANRSKTTTSSSSSRPTLGSDSPLSPYASDSEKRDIVVPIPLRPTAPAGGGVSRKHRRVFSGRSNPAMAHRRVNTRGDKSSNEKEFEGLDDESDDESDDQLLEQQDRRKKSFTMSTYEQPLSPATEAMPPPLPNRPPQAPPPPPHQYPPTYAAHTPPPSYDPYNNYGGQHPPPQHPHSSGTPRSSPVVSGYPQQQVAAVQQGSPSCNNQSTPSSTQSAPAGYNFTRSNSHPLPDHLGQPSLDEEHPLSPKSQRTQIKIHTDEKLFGDKKGQHKKEPSINPLPYQNDGHHRKQSSLGSFLATTDLFDEGDLDIFYEDSGYASAPEEGDHLNTNSHNKTLSSASFMRSLSSDDFLKQLHEEEAKEAATSNNDTPSQHHAPPPPHPSHPPNPPNGHQMHSTSPVMSHPQGYKMHSTSPVMSHPYAPSPPLYPPTAAPGYGYPHPPTPPGSMPGYGTPPPGSYPGTPTGYYQYGTWPHPNQQPHSASPSLPMHYSPDPQMQYQQSPYQYSQPPFMPHSDGYDVCQPALSNGQTQELLTEEQKRSSRRKCSVPECPNRVVQGGLCIAHGAKRKTCNHPGCTKNVKKAGMCSTHGPARKRCEFEGCVKVAVQGGRCIAHGAKKKVCSLEECTKQAIVGGMCKKHYDEVNGIVKVRGQRKKAAANNKQQPKSKAGESKNEGKGNHERGLSLFQDDDLMNTIINNVPQADNDGLHGLSAI